MTLHAEATYVIGYSVFLTYIDKWKTKDTILIRFKLLFKISPLRFEINGIYGLTYLFFFSFGIKFLINAK